MKDQAVLTYTKSDFISFYRFDTYFSSLCSTDHPERIRIENAVPIKYEDILKALENMQRSRAGILTIYEEWLNPLLLIGDQIGLSSLLDEESMKDIDWDNIGALLPLDRAGALLYVFGDMQIQSTMTADGRDEVVDVQPWIDMLKNVLFNETHSFNEWRLTEEQKVSYIENLFAGNLIDIVSDDEKALFKRCLEEECEAGLLEAWRIKAYCLSSGDSVYPCDRMSSADILASLYDEEGNPFDAALLGRMLYEGLDDEEPDYEEAYRYLSIASFNGILSAMCRCADMLVKGEGVPVSTGAAAQLVQTAYAHTKRSFTNGDTGCCFGEAAMRMGDYARYGIGMDKDEMIACSYYLEALNAVTLRMRNMGKPDDQQLYKDVMERLSQSEKELGRKIRRSIFQSEKPYMLDRLLSGGNDLLVKVKAEHHQTYLLISRIPEEADSYILATCEEMSYSRLVRQVVIRADGFHSLSMHAGKSLRFDQIGWDDGTGETIFMKNGKVCAKMACRQFVFADDRDPGWRQEPVMEFASVIFPGETKEYDFICDLDGLKRGDRVIVDTKYGPSEAIFLRKYPAKMSEMPLAADRYKRILQKKDAYPYA